MDDGISNHDLYELIYGPDEPSASFTTTPTDPLVAATTTISNQMLLSSPSAPTFVPTPTLNNNMDDQNQMLDWGQHLEFDHDVTATYNNISTGTDGVMLLDNHRALEAGDVMLLDNHRALEDTIFWDQQPGFCPEIQHVPTYNTTMSTTPGPRTINTNRDWIDSSFSATILNYQGNNSSSSNSASSNLYDGGVGEEIRRLNRLLEEINNQPPPAAAMNNVKQKKKQKQHQPLTSKNWPVLTIPFLGKLTDTTATNKHQQQQQPPPIFSTQTHESNTTRQWKKEKRVYKMPMDALKNDVWSWRKYGEKSVDDSPYPRVYYKCNSSKDCKARRRVEQSAPNLVCLKYTGNHNHQIPMFMASSSSSASGKDKKSPNSPSGTANKIMKKDETVSEDDFVDVEN